MNNQTFDFQRYTQMPVSVRKTMLKMIDLLAANEGSAAYMMVYEHDPDPELREIARQALEKNGIKVGETDRPSTDNPGETHYQVDDPANDGTKTIALDGGDGQVRTPAQLADTPNLFILDRSERGFLSGKSAHPSRRPIYGSGLFLLVWTAVLILLLSQFSSMPKNSTFYLFMAFFALGEVVAAIFFIRALQRERLFERQGKLLLGQIVNAHGRWVISNSSSGHGSTSRSFDVTVSYVVRTPSGQKLTSGSTRTRGDLQNAVMPEAGTPVAVMYVDDKTFMLL